MFCRYWRFLQYPKDTHEGTTAMTVDLPQGSWVSGEKRQMIKQVDYIAILTGKRWQLTILKSNGSKRSKAVTPLGLATDKSN